MSLLVIAGAGASYDSDRSARPRQDGRPATEYPYEEEARPPLAAQLFEPHRADTPYGKAVDRFRRAAPVISRLRDATSSGVAVEQALGQLQDERVTYPELNAQLAAVRYYLRDAIAGVENQWFERCNHFTNHMDLIDRLAQFHHRTKRPVLVVTFNYDTLIERAMEDVLNADLSTIVGYTQRSDIRLFKPHGSIHWTRLVAIPADVWRDIEGMYPMVEQENAIIELSQNAEVLNHYSVNPRRVLAAGGQGTTAWSPAIAIPTVMKQQYEAPSEHIDALRDALPDVTDVLVIGWRGAERHFLHLLRDHLGANAGVTVVAEQAEAAQITIDQLWRTQKFTRYRRLGEGFSGLFDRSGPGAPTVLDEILANSLSWAERGMEGIDPLPWDAADET